ncbi:MAG: hypothetical protein ABL949_02165 [Fimbriimonadaceae bacterium]
MKTSIRIIAFAALSASLIYGFRPANASKATTSAAGLEWTNGLEASVAKAKSQKRPILFLSMFGKLDEKMPCANARTLRATLFKDPAFHELANNDVVLGWEMVRAVPRVTIDLGDGKPIQRTVRGNAVMYLLNSDGKVIDAFPGIYTADDFLPMVKREIAELANAKPEIVREFHVKNRVAMMRTVRATMSKSAMESPTLDLIGASAIAGVKSEKPLSTDPNRRMFEQMAAGITDMSLTPMSAERAVGEILGRQRQGLAKDELAKLILKADSRRNMESVRPVVHAYLASESELPTVAQARDNILETILKIPYKDPYFGLKDVLLPGTPD